MISSQTYARMPTIMIRPGRRAVLRRPSASTQVDDVVDPVFQPRAPPEAGPALGPVVVKRPRVRHERDALGTLARGPSPLVMLSDRRRFP
jgi:hypothetical protein